MFFDIFLEAIIDVSILPFGDQNSFYATLQFQPDQAIPAVAVAIVGAAIALAINWNIGHIIGNYLQEKKPPAKFQEFRCVFQAYGWPVLLLVWAPLGIFLPLIAAVLGYRLKPTLLITIPSMLGFYIYQLVSVL